MGAVTPPPRIAAAADEGRHGGSSDVRLGRRFLIGATLIVGVSAVVAAFATGTQVDEAHAGEIRRVFDGGTALCGLAVFALCRATWRQIGDRAALFAGAASLSVGVAAVARPELLGVLLGTASPDPRSLVAVSEAATALVPVLFAAGLVPWLRQRRCGAAAVLAVSGSALVVLAFGLKNARGLGPALGVAQLIGGHGARAAVLGVVVTLLWLGLAVGYTVQGLHRHRLYTWAALLLFALTLSNLAAGAAGPSNSWTIGAAVLELLGVLAAVVGCHLDLTRAYEDQTLLLFDSDLEAETAQVRERVRVANIRVRRHDLINAITAIDGAAMILEKEFERLSGSDRETLARVVGSGTARLRRLVSQERSAESRVSLADTAADVARDPVWSTDLELDVTDDLVAAGSSGETTEALHQLVEFAHRRAPGSPVTLRGERDGSWVVLRVEDRGPTMSRALRRTVTERESRTVSGGEGAALRVAARLMRSQGGDLWVEPRPGGGTSFGICLPALAAGGGTDG